MNEAAFEAQHAHQMRNQQCGTNSLRPSKGIFKNKNKIEIYNVCLAREW